MPAGREAAARLYAAALPGLQRAADRGNRGACMVPAAMYAHGKGVEADVKKAARYASKVQCKGLAPCDSNQTKSCGNKACGKPSGVKSHAGKCCTPTQSCAPKLPLEAPAPKAWVSPCAQRHAHSARRGSCGRFFSRRMCPPFPAYSRFRSAVARPNQAVRGGLSRLRLCLAGVGNGSEVETVGRGAEACCFAGYIIHVGTQLI